MHGINLHLNEYIEKGYISFPFKYILENTYLDKYMLWEYFTKYIFLSKLAPSSMMCTDINNDTVREELEKHFEFIKELKSYYCKAKLGYYIRSHFMDNIDSYQSPRDYLVISALTCIKVIHILTYHLHYNIHVKEACLLMCSELQHIMRYSRKYKLYNQEDQFELYKDLMKIDTYIADLIITILTKLDGYDSLFKHEYSTEYLMYLTLDPLPWWYKDTNQLLISEGKNPTTYIKQTKLKSLIGKIQQFLFHKPLKSKLICWLLKH